MDYNIRDNIKPGLPVSIVLKKDQRTGKRTNGLVKDILTKSPRHSRGIKVRLESGEIGRVCEILDSQDEPGDSSTP
ncbi:YwbE family protein [candidate division KSB1 bacterium]|nr:YwbE family protein [candidate division KSB1 bacterium]